MERRILVVDGDPQAAARLGGRLATPDRSIQIADDPTAALELLVDESFSLVVAAAKLPGLSGRELVRELRRKGIDVPALLIGEPTLACGEADDRAEAIAVADLEAAAERALGDLGFGLIGRSHRMREVARLIRRVAPRSYPVLIAGESGTGKELVARAIHAAGPVRGSGPLVTVACSTLSGPLFESELFGHERGAFTGAQASKPGRVERARGGTLFLDEIGDLTLEMQSKLLRVLQEGTFERVGGTETLRVEARILSSTHADLRHLVERGLFREDLYHRLKVVSIALPPLRERLEDIPLLVRSFLELLAGQGAPLRRFSPEALRLLCRHSWPGNVRELQGLVETAVYLGTGEEVVPEEIADALDFSGPEPFALDYDLNQPWADVRRELTERVERAYLRALLSKHNGRIQPCAEECGLSRRSLSAKLRLYRIDKAEFKQAPAASRRSPSGRAAESSSLG